METLAVKYRPKTWEEVSGQEITVKILKNIVLSKQIHPAYLFTGLYGCGKTSLCRIFSKAINCENRDGADPCNKCLACKNLSISDYVEMDGATSGRIDEIRALQESAQYTPTTGKYKVFVIDEAHALSNTAFQALLKILEEPPAHVIFILATTELQKVPKTLQSRCMVFALNFVSEEDIIRRISFIADKENIKIEKEALSLIAGNCQNSMRDGIVLLEQLKFFTANKTITSDSVREILAIVDETYYSSLLENILLKQNKQIIVCLDNLRKLGCGENTVISSLMALLSKLIRQKEGFLSPDPKFMQYDERQLIYTFKYLLGVKNKVETTFMSKWATLEFSLLLAANVGAGSLNGKSETAVLVEDIQTNLFN